MGFQIISLNQGQDAVELSTERYENFEILPIGPSPIHLKGAGLEPLQSLPLYGELK
jgi:hypothetical protein